MKIGLIGNINNNNFAVMRYFRDLGADAHLLLYSNDGTGTLSHFTPEADTWEMERWSPFIHPTVIPNAPISAFSYPLSSAVGVWSKIKRWTGAQEFSVSPVSRAQLRSAYTAYDRLIGSGTTPAALSRIGRALDIFYPYSLGVEFLGSYEFTARNRGPWFRRHLQTMLYRRQLHGLKSARCVVSTDLEVTAKVLEQVGVQSIQKTIPMVYNREKQPLAPPSATLAAAFGEIRTSSLSLLHHARLMWKKNEAYSTTEHALSTKNSDWLFRAFARLVAARPKLSVRLFVVEYGPDVAATKELARQLKIQDSVTWLPKMPRRELMWLLDHVSIGVGQFYNAKSMIWGGTGWEALASGKPLLQGFRFDKCEFEGIYGFPPPPMLPARSEEDVLKQLLFVADNPEQAAQIGKRARDWFNTYNGIGLAKTWLELAKNGPVPDPVPASILR